MTSVRKGFFDIFNLRRHLPASLRSLSVALFWSSAGFIVYRLSIILSTVIIGRVSGTAGLSSYGVFQISVQNFTTFAVLGLSVPVMKYAVLADSDKIAKARLSLSVQFFAVMSIMSCLIYVLTETFSKGLPNMDWQFSTLVIFSILGTALYSFSSAIAIGRKQYRQVSLAMIAGSMVILIGAAIFIYAPKKEILFTSYALSSFVIFFVISRKLPSYIFQSIAQRLDYSHARHIVYESGTMALISAIVAIVPYLIMNVLQHTDQSTLLISLFFVGTQLFGLSMLLNSRVAQVIFPLQVEIAQDAGAQASRTRDRKLILAATAGTAITVLPIIPFMPFILSIYAPEMSSYAWPITPMLLASIPAAAMQVAGSSLVAHNRYAAWLGVTFIWGITTATSLMIWLHIALPFAAGAAYVTGYIIGFAAAFFMHRRG